MRCVWSIHGDHLRRHEPPRTVSRNFRPSQPPAHSGPRQRPHTATRTPGAPHTLTTHVVETRCRPCFPRERGGRPPRRTWRTWSAPACARSRAPARDLRPMTRLVCMADIDARIVCMAARRGPPARIYAVGAHKRGATEGRISAGGGQKDRLRATCDRYGVD